MWLEDWCFRDIYKFEQGYLFEGVLEKDYCHHLLEDTKSQYCVSIG